MSSASSFGWARPKSPSRRRATSRAASGTRATRMRTRQSPARSPWCSGKRATKAWYCWTTSSELEPETFTRWSSSARASSTSPASTKSSTRRVMVRTSSGWRRRWAARIRATRVPVPPLWMRWSTSGVR
jgi:hypothetical protein